jgi:hypothetical protein
MIAVGCGHRRAAAGCEARGLGCGWASGAAGRSTHERVIVGFAHLAGEMPVGLIGVVAGEPLVLRVPVERSAQAEGDDAEMAERCGAMADLGVADGVLARADAVEEVAHVIATDLESESGVGEWGGHQVLLAGGEVTAGDPEPAVGAFEPDPVALAVAVDDTAEDIVVRGRAGDVFDAVCVVISDLVFAEGGIPAGDGLGEHPGLDAGGSVLADGPAGDVVVVSAPVGEGPARIIEPVAKRGVTAFAHVIDPRGLAEVVIPIERGGDGRGLEGAVAEAGGQGNDHALEFADPLVADELGGEAEFRVAALLAAGLEDGAMFLDGLGQAAAFVDGEGEGFLGVDILAGVSGGEVDEGMPVIRSGLDDDVNIGPFEEFAEVAVSALQTAGDDSVCQAGRGPGLENPPGICERRPGGICAPWS